MNHIFNHLIANKQRFGSIQPNPKKYQKNANEEQKTIVSTVRKLKTDSTYYYESLFKITLSL